MGGAAVGLPAIANALVSRRGRRLPPPAWGRGDRYRWQRGEIAYQRLGAGPPLVLLHSLGPGHSAAEWRRAAEILAAGIDHYLTKPLRKAALVAHIEAAAGKDVRPPVPQEAPLGSDQVLEPAGHGIEVARQMSDLVAPATDGFADP